MIALLLVIVLSVKELHYHIVKLNVIGQIINVPHIIVINHLMDGNNSFNYVYQQKIIQTINAFSNSMDFFSIRDTCT